LTYFKRVVISLVFYDHCLVYGIFLQFCLTTVDTRKGHVLYLSHFYHRFTACIPEVIVYCISASAVETVLHIIDHLSSSQALFKC